MEFNSEIKALVKEFNINSRAFVKLLMVNKKLCIHQEMNKI